MQSRAGSDAHLRDDGLRALTEIKCRGDDEGFAGPDFVDPAVFDEEELEEGEEVDEGEMRRLVMGRAKGWIDWAGGWMDLRGEDMEDGDEEDEDVTISEKRENRRGKQRRPGDIYDYGKNQEVLVLEPPPLENAGIVADTKWLLGVARKLIV